MKKINIFALILIMCLIFFTGCGKGQTDTKTQPGNIDSDSLAIKYNESNSMDEVFIVGGSVGLSKAIENDDYEFLIYELPDGSLAVGNQVSTPLASFSGVYKKVADDVPNEKSLGV